MTKQITTYLLFAACFFSACQTDYDEPASGTSGEREALSLTVSTSDIVVSDEAVTRASDKGGATTFEIDDCVGLIVLDKDGNFLADNVPYKFDGNNWNFDADNKEGKQRVYYDATMSTYIIYYPYHPSANGIKDESGIKNLPIFAHREDQSDKMAYRFSDLMMWSFTGKAIKQITANLEHTRKSLSLDIKVRWSLGLPKYEYDILEYQPLKEALEDFEILYQDGTPILNATTDITYHAEDGTYRYILPERYEGKLSWSYTYRGESFCGECTVSTQQAMGTRYVGDTYAYMGESKGEKVEAFDYYCSKDIDGEKYGYVLPWDAEKHFREHHIIGIVLHAGQHAEDISDYLESGIGQRSCNGYVIALTDVPTGKKVAWAPKGTKKVGTHANRLGWSGYYNLIQMKKYAETAGTNFAEAFPAAYACVIYGNLRSEFAAPVNTSGWLLPTYGMWHTAKSLNKEIESCLSTISKNVPDDCSYKDKIELWHYDDADGYWSSTEYDIDITKAYFFRADKNYMAEVKDATKSVWAFLVF